MCLNCWSKPLFFIPKAFPINQSTFSYKIISRKTTQNFYTSNFAFYHAKSTQKYILWIRDIQNALIAFLPKLYSQVKAFWTNHTNFHLKRKKAEKIKHVSTLKAKLVVDALKEQ